MRAPLFPLLALGWLTRICVAGDPCVGATHHCFELGPAGCNDEPCCNAVCQADPSCCATAWDVDCVAQSIALCPTAPCTVGCPPGSTLEADPCGGDTNSGCDGRTKSGSTCCFASGPPSCDDPVCMGIVCAQDPFCCMVAWDEICADEAIKLCPELCAPGLAGVTPLTLGTSMCGGTWAALGERDADWYEFTVDDVTLVTVELLSKTPLNVAVADNGGSGSCGAITDYEPLGTTIPCTPLATSVCLPPGTHWLVITPVLDDGLVCNTASTRYLLKASVAGIGCTLPDPPNDICATALPIVLGTTPVSTIDAATEGPELAAECAGASLSAVERDVWFRFDAPRDGILRATTCGTADFEARLAAYEGACDALVLLACDDGENGCPSLDPRLETATTAGSTYFLRIGGRIPAEGTALLTLAYLPCEQPYALEYLPLPDGFTETRSAAINALGDIVGVGGRSNDDDAVRWDADGNVTVITPRSGPGDYVQPFDLNDVGVAVGYRYASPGAFTVPSDTFVALPAVAGCTTSDVAAAINESGVIVGYYQSGFCSQRGVRWVNGVAESLPVPAGARRALAINERGMIAGEGDGGVWLLDGTSFQWLPTPPNATDMRLAALTDDGVLFGDYETLNQPNVPQLFRWQRGILTTIELPSPYTGAYAIDMANDGTILCSLLGNGFGTTLALWKPNGLPRPLHEIIDPIDVGFLESYPGEASIAGALRIAATARDTWNWPFQSRAVRLTPRPPVLDLDCDGVIGGADLGLVLGAWGPCPMNDPCIADVDVNGIVDAADLALILGGWTPR
jgi:hypothetical protein